VKHFHDVGRMPTPNAIVEHTPRINQRGVPTHECFNCGGRLFTIQASFENYDISGWLLDAECAYCHSPLTVPCPVDNPEYDPL